MNIGLVTSFLVGGLLLLSILQMNFMVNSNAMQTTMQLTAKNRMTAITETLNNDFSRMGYNVTGQNIEEISGSTKITFYGDIDDNGTADEVTWEFKGSSSFAATPNPNDFELVRTGITSSTSGSVETVYSAVDFSLTFLGINGAETSDLTMIRQIQVEVLCESPEAISFNTSGDGKSYGRSYWQKTIVPPGLQF